MTAFLDQLERDMKRENLSVAPQSAPKQTAFEKMMARDLQQLEPKQQEQTDFERMMERDLRQETKKPAKQSEFYRQINAETASTKAVAPAVEDESRFSIRDGIIAPRVSDLRHMGRVLAGSGASKAKGLLQTLDLPAKATLGIYDAMARKVGQLPEPTGEDVLREPTLYEKLTRGARARQGYAEDYLANAPVLNEPQRELAQASAQRLTDAMEKGGLPRAIARQVGDLGMSLGWELLFNRAVFGAITPGKAASAATRTGTGLTAKAAWRAGAAKTLQYVGKKAFETFVTTEGSMSDKIKSAALASVYSGTPISSSLMGRNSSAIVIDALTNMGISVATGKVKDAVDKSKNWQEAIVNLIPVLGPDVVMSLWTRSAKVQHNLGKLSASIREEAGKAFDAAIEREFPAKPPALPGTKPMQQTGKPAEQGMSKEAQEALAQARVDVAISEAADKAREDIWGFKVTRKTPEGQKHEIHKKAYMIGRDIMRREIRQRDVEIDIRRKAAYDFVKKYVPADQHKKMLSKLGGAHPVKTDAQLNRLLDHADTLIAVVDKRNAIKDFTAAVKASSAKVEKKYVDAINAITSSFDPKKISSGKRRELEQRKAFLLANPDFKDMPKSVRDEVARLDKIPLHKMDAEDIRSLADRVKQISHEAEFKKKLVMGRAGRTRETLYEEARENVYNVSAEKSKIPFRARYGLDEESIGFPERTTKNAFLEVDSTSLLTKAEAMDGGVRDGANSKIFYKNFIDSDNAEKQMYIEGRKLLSAGMKVAGMDPTWSRALSGGGFDAKDVSVKLPHGRRIVLTRGERISLLMHSKNEHNRKAFATAGFVPKVNSTKFPRKLSSADFDAIVKSATPGELRFVQFLEYLDRVIIKPRMNETSRKIWGFDFANIETYWQAARKKQKGKAVPDSLSDAVLENLSMTKKRTGGSGSPIILEDALSQAYRQLKTSSMFAGYAESVKTAQLYLKDINNERAIVEKFGRPFYDGLRQSVSDIENVGTAVAKLSTEKFLDRRINNVTQAIFGANPWIIQKQGISYIQAKEEFSTQEWVSGLKPLSKEQKKTMLSYPFFAARAEGRVNRELGDLVEANTIRSDYGARLALGTRLTKGISWEDMRTISKVWQASTTYVKNNFPELKGKEFNDAVAAKAQDASIRTQPTYDTKDRSPIANRRGFGWRLATMFTTQPSKSFNMGARAVDKYNNIEKPTIADKKDLGVSLALAVALPAAALASVNMLRDLAYRRGEKWLKKDEDKFNKMKFAVESAKKAAGNVYFGKIIANTIDAVTLTRRYKQGNMLTDSANMLGDIVYFAAQAVEKATSNEAADEDKWKKSAAKAAKISVDLAGRWTGVASGNLARLAELPYIWDEHIDE